MAGLQKEEQEVKAKGVAIVGASLLCLVAFGACGNSKGHVKDTEATRPGRLMEVKPPSRDLSSYPFLEIVDFENPLPGIIPQSLSQDLSEELALRAKLTRRFDGVTQVEAQAPASEEMALVLSGRFVDIDTAGTSSGSGRRAPTAFLTAEVALTDKTSGQVVSRVLATGYGTAGGRGGSEEKALVQSLSKVILNYITTGKP